MCVCVPLRLPLSNTLVSSDATPSRGGAGASITGDNRAAASAVAHEVMPFQGRRYCIIWYKVFDRRMTAAAPIFEPARIVYEHQATPQLR
eukprot:COSAG01_NODE_221_length_21422_cov_48.284294_10_plen_90_part_00